MQEEKKIVVKGRYIYQCSSFDHFAFIEQEEQITNVKAKLIEAQYYLYGSKKKNF